MIPYIIEFIPEESTYGAEVIEDMDGWKTDSMGRSECPHPDS